MDRRISSRAAGRNTPRNPSSSPVAEDELFHEFFDWRLYCETTQPLEKPSHYTTSRRKPRNLSKLITRFTPSSSPSASSSPPALDSLAIDDLQSEFYRMKAPFRSDDESANTSDYSGHSPPELVQGGGSTSPSDHSGSVFLDHAEERLHSSDVTLREVQAQDDEWTYPQADLAKATRHMYPTHILVHSEKQQRRSEGQKRHHHHQSAVPASQAAGTKRRHSGKDLEKRHRQLADPNRTADVRKSGACVPCRVTKTRCHDSGVCPTCRTAFPLHSHLVCTRTTPAMAWPVMAKVPDFWSATAYDEELLASGPRFYTGQPRDIAIFFSKDTPSSSLHATVQAYRPTSSPDESGSPRTVAFPREKVPSHPKLQKWVEDQIKLEHNAEFGNALQSFLLAYSKEGLKRLPKYNLVKTVHKMNCFFRIWKMQSFCCRDPSRNIANLPLSVQAQLRSIARKALDLLEHDVLKLLDDCLTQGGSPKPEERLAIWASLWQLILMYRELLIAFSIHLHYSAQDGRLPQDHIVAQTHQYRRLTENFFPLLAVFYHYQFRTKKSIEFSVDWLDSGSGSHIPREDRSVIKHIGLQLLSARQDFYDDILSSDLDIDGMLRVLIVEHELKKLKARKRSSKSSTSKSKHRHSDYDDE